YYITVTTTLDPDTILYSEFIGNDAKTGSPELITTYTDFAAVLAASPLTVYRVNVYIRSIVVNWDGADVLSTIPGTATITDSAFVTTAKHLGGTTNYYEIDNAAASPTTYDALIPATGSGDNFVNMTLVFCIYPNEHGDFDVFATEGYQFYCYGNDTDGGLSVGGRTWNNGTWGVTVAATGSPTDGEPLPIGAWHSVMISMSGNVATSPETSTMKIWVDGAEVYNGAVSNTNERRPMAWAGKAWVGTGDAYDGLDCYLSYVWCKEEYLDPSTYWSSFFDGSNKPLD
ncbi:unnamed protein product, partial [marine sediment metagenome]